MISICPKSASIPGASTLFPESTRGVLIRDDLRCRQVAVAVHDSLGRVIELLRHSPDERASMNPEGFDMPESVARAREAEIGDGDRVAFTQEIVTPASLWNRRFSNDVNLVVFRDQSQFFADLEQYAPKWIVVGH